MTATTSSAADAVLKRADVTDGPKSVPIPTLEERRRTSLAVARLALEVPPIPGFTLYWFENTPPRIFEAQNASWQFVAPEEIAQFAYLKGRETKITHGGDVGGLVLMKLPDHLAALDKQLQEEERKKVANLLQTNKVGRSSNPYGSSHLYTPGNPPEGTSTESN